MRADRQGVEREVGVGALAGGLHVGHGAGHGGIRQAEFAAVFAPKGFGIMQGQGKGAAGNSQAGQGKQECQQVSHQGGLRVAVLSYEVRLTAF